MDRRQFIGALCVGAADWRARGVSRAQRNVKRLAGVFPIAFTPVNAGGKVDFDGLAAQVQFCRSCGVHGLAWPQIASGWTTLTEAERMSGADAMVSAARHGPTSIVIGVQSNNGDFAETGRYARQSERLGADAIICIPPANMMAPAELLSFYQRVGSLTSLPMFAQTAGDFGVDVLVEMINTIATFRYVKDEAGEPLERVGEIRRRTNGQLQCFSGLGVKTMITEMERGFTGHCPFMSLADLYASAYDLYHAGRPREAFDQFGRIQAASAMFSQNNINVLVARGVLRPGTTVRAAPAAPGANSGKVPAETPEEIKRVLETFLSPYIRT